MNFEFYRQTEDIATLISLCTTPFADFQAGGAFTRSGMGASGGLPADQVLLLRK
jgi:hypothetical protein